MNYLVTGGAGFIGSNIVLELLRRRENVRILDNFSTGKRENLAGRDSEVEILEGDIRDYDTVRRAVEGIDVILHQAALPSVLRSVQDPISTNEVNVVGTLNVLKAATSARVRRVVYASSSSVYGENPSLPKHERMEADPLSPYAVSKLTGELYCRVFARLYGLTTVILRYFNVFGPHQDPSSQYAAVIPRFITAVLDSQSPVIYGDGQQTRDFTYVANVVYANLLAATKECKGGTILNCASHRQVSLNELVAKINAHARKDIPATYEPSRPGDIKHSYASIDRIHHILGYEVLVGFDDGLRKTVEWFKQKVQPGIQK